MQINFKNEIFILKYLIQGFPGGSVVKHPPASAGFWVRSLVWGEPTCCGAAEPVCHIYWSLHALEPVFHRRDATTKNWCFWTEVLEKTPESPLDCKEIQPVHPKGDQSWVFIGRTAAEAETPILWPPDVKSWFIGKDLDAGKDWRQVEKGTIEDEMVGWHHRLNGLEFE